MASEKNNDLHEYLDRVIDRYLSYRPRTRLELERYIRRKIRNKTESPDEENEITEQRLSLLRDQGHIDDLAFAQWYVSEKQYFKPRGQIRLKSELKAKGISPDVIDKAFQTAQKTDTELLADLLRKKYTKSDFETDDIKRKNIQRLLRRGFSYGDIKKSIEDFMKKE